MKSVTSIIASKWLVEANELVTFTVQVTDECHSGLQGSVNIWHTAPDGQRFDDPSVPLADGKVAFQASLALGGRYLYITADPPSSHTLMYYESENYTILPRGDRWTNEITAFSGTNNTK